MKNLQFQVSETYVALGAEGTARPLAVGPTFWQDLAAGRFGAFDRLVAHGGYEADWAHWEMHPQGEEFVMLIEGEVEMLLERDGENSSEHLTQSGAYVLIPRGTWHTARVHRPSRMLFITAGAGTQHRPA